MRIGHLEFSSKAKAGDFFRAILRRHGPGAAVIGQDAADLAALLKLHPHYMAKLGCGIAGFTVRLDDFGQQGFELIRTDGSRTDFSYRECISPTSPRTRFRGALRLVVAADIVTARNAYLDHNSGRIFCAETGVRLALAEAHLDHRWPLTFEALAEEFGTVHSLVDYGSLLAPHRDGNTGDRLVDPRLAANFRDFHAAVAELDFVSKQVNLAHRKIQRPAPAQIVLREWLT